MTVRLGNCSVTESLPNLCNALGLIPGTGEKEKDFYVRQNRFEINPGSRAGVRAPLVSAVSLLAPASKVGLQDGDEP